MANKRCFIISPIGTSSSEIREHANSVYDFIIKPAVEELRAGGIEIDPQRSDELEEPGKITHQMFREIFQNDLCIAILTYSNPNVFYELAVAQCAYRPLVALLKEGEQLPFDVADLRTVLYDLEKPRRVVGRLDAKELAGQIRAMLSEDWYPPDFFGPHAPAAWALARDREGLQRKIETARPRPLRPGEDGAYYLPEDQDRRVVIRTGDIRYVEDVDIVVSSENTDLQLARYYDPSISGTLRYLDAERGRDGRVIRDAVDGRIKTLISEAGINLPVMPGTVFDLKTTGLAEKNIKYVFLAVTVRGKSIGSGYSPVAQEDVQGCVYECFKRFDELAKKEPLESILFPVFGAGTAKQDPEQAVGILMPAIIEAVRRTTACRRTYLLAWVESHRAALHREARRLDLKRCEG